MDGVRVGVAGVVVVRVLMEGLAQLAGVDGELDDVELVAVVVEDEEADARVLVAHEDEGLLAGAGLKDDALPACAELLLHESAHVGGVERLCEVVKLGDVEVGDLAVGAGAGEEADESHERDVGGADAVARFQRADDAVESLAAAGEHGDGNSKSDEKERNPEEAAHYLPPLLPECEATPGTSAATEPSAPRLPSAPSWPS